MANKDVSPASYLKFREFLEKQCGIVLGDNKQYLVRSRLASLLYKHKYESADELIDVVVKGFDRTLLQNVIDAMTTNETLWFRDNYPFDLLVKELLPTLSAKNQKLRIWSAACSSGQEPYSIAMSVLEYQRQRPGALRAGVEIVATDLSSEMLQKCELGIYDELSLARGLSPQKFLNILIHCIPRTGSLRSLNSVVFLCLSYSNLIFKMKHYICSSCRDDFGIL